MKQQAVVVCYGKRVTAVIRVLGGSRDYRNR